MREFETGATRDTADGKPELAKYLSPLVIKRFGEYMLKHQTQPDGQKRAGDNWKKGITLGSYLDSAFRHFLDWWLLHDGYKGREDIETALCALIFNAQGYLHEILKCQNGISSEVGYANPGDYVPVTDTSPRPVEKKPDIGHVAPDNDLGWRVVPDE